MPDLDLKEILKKKDFEKIVDSLQIEKRYFNENPSDMKYFNLLTEIANLNNSDLRDLEESAFYDAQIENKEHIFEHILENYKDVLVQCLLSSMGIKRIETIIGTDSFPSLKKAAEFAYREQQRRQVAFKQIF